LQSRRVFVPSESPRIHQLVRLTEADIEAMDAVVRNPTAAFDVGALRRVVALARFALRSARPSAEE
jgi:hypothetical protein